jgi:hypothetical protein
MSRDVVAAPPAAVLGGRGGLAIWVIKSSGAAGAGRVEPGTQGHESATDRRADQCVVLADGRTAAAGWSDGHELQRFPRATATTPTGFAAVHGGLSS